MDFSTIVQSDLNQQLSFINGILLFERSLSLAANAEVTIYSLIGQELFKTDNNYFMDSLTSTTHFFGILYANPTTTTCSISSNLDNTIG